MFLLILIKILMMSVVEAEVGAEAEGVEGDAAGVVMETTIKMMVDTITQVEVVD